jgi:hypothetical protein
MLEAILTSNLLLALALWVIVYISDYYCTLHTSRLYHAYGKPHISYGGSLELTPQFQGDIDNLRAFSPRFIRLLAISLPLISLVWFLSHIVLRVDWLFSLLIGGLLLREAAIHIRHMRNFALFRYAKQPGHLTGRLEYSRPAVLGQSTADLLGFALLFLFTYVVTGSWFLLGGTLACAVAGQQHWAMAKKASHKTSIQG